MSKSVLRALVLTAVAATAIPTVAGAAALRINCDPATFPDFTSIGGAFTAGAVADGDTLVVEECAIFPFAYREAVDLSGLVGVRLVAADSAYFGARFEGVAVGVTPPPVVIDGDGLAAPCIRIDGSVDVAVHGFRIIRCAQQGVIVTDSVRTLLEGNFVRASLEPILDDGGSGTRITGNQVQGTILLVSSQAAMVADNFATTDAPPIVIDGGAECSITNNYANSAGPEAIDVRAGTGHRVERNTAIANTNSIRIRAAALDTDVVGNAITTPILDNGTGSDVLNNF